MRPFLEQFRTIQHYWDAEEWLGRRMLFLSGPRQVGKTTLVTSTLCRKKEAYFNWDDRKVRLRYQNDPDFFAGVESERICFDEIHKRPRWKDILKGAYDAHKDRYRFIVTGSARLETFRKSGDSLVGRYFHTRLFPLNLPDFRRTDFSLPDRSESLALQAADEPDAKHLEDLLRLGGFPEPFFAGREDFWKRWSSNHNDLIVREDLRDLSRVLELDKVEALLEMLRPSVGNTVSYRNLAADLETTHGSVRRWLEVLNRVQLVFSVPPYSRKLRRAYRKERKWYYVDWKAADTNRFENYVAASLWRAVTLYTDRFGDKMSLHFVRTHDGTEVDFLICRSGSPWLLVEVKEGRPEVSSACHRFSALFGVPCFVVTQNKNFFMETRRPAGPRIFCLSWSKLGPLLP